MKHIFKCIDAHTCGNPVRLVVEGGPSLEGHNMMERRLHFIKDFDWIRKALMFEPRGHDMMSGSILYPPSDPKNDIGILFIETSGCLPMCGHGTIGTVTIMLEENIVTPKMEGQLRLETPAGLIQVEYQRDGHRVSSVKLKNIASYLHAQDLSVQCPDLGPLRFDVAYGGNFYAIIDRQNNFSGIQDFKADQLIRWSRIIRERINNQFEFQHPTDLEIHGLTHILWAGDTIHPKSDGRNAVFYGDKAIDRSPCGTGTSARMAQLFAKGKLQVGEEYIHESYIGSTFIGRIEEVTTVGDFQAIRPSIEGWARIIGHNNIIVDSEDPYATGFQVI